VQEKAVKMVTVTGLKSKDYKERCAELGLETLEERRLKQDMALVHKLIKDGHGEGMFEFRANNGARGHNSARTHSSICKNRHKKVFFCSESSGALELSARLCKTGSR
jgi:hypothetical protein